VERDVEFSMSGSFSGVLKVVKRDSGGENSGKVMELTSIFPDINIVSSAMVGHIAFFSDGTYTYGSDTSMANPQEHKLGLGSHVSASFLDNQILLMTEGNHCYNSHEHNTISFPLVCDVAKRRRIVAIMHWIILLEIMRIGSTGLAERWKRQ